MFVFPEINLLANNSVSENDCQGENYILKGFANWLLKKWNFSSYVFWLFIQIRAIELKETFSRLPTA